MVGGMVPGKKGCSSLFKGIIACGLTKKSEGGGVLGVSMVRTAVAPTG